MDKRNMLALKVGACILTVVCVLAGVFTFLASSATTRASGRVQRADDDRAVTINQLKHISVVGSTAFVLDAKGQTVSVDANPYGIAIVPATAKMQDAPGTLKAGDIVVTDIGANHDGNILVDFPAKNGPAHLFNTTQNAMTKGPADMAFNTATGTNWVANLAGNNVQIFAPNGSVMATLQNPLFNKPWGMAFNNGTHNAKDGAVGSFFTSNAGDATIDRIDIISGANGPTFRVFQIGQLTKGAVKTKIGLTWLPSLQVGEKRFDDVLLAIDPVNNRIAAYPDSTTANTTLNRAVGMGITVFQGKPLNNPGGFAISPTTGDLLVVNLNDNNLVELSMKTGKVIGVRQVDNVPVNPADNNGSALFGVAATTDSKGNLVVYYTDDNLNTLNMLGV